MLGRVEQAIAFAVKAHNGQKRKIDKTPFIFHPLEDANIVAGMTDDEDVIIAAVLHDTVEDTDTTIEDIQAAFGRRVAQLVSHETEDKREHMSPADSWKIRKEESLELLKNSDDINIKILWLGDKLANMRSLYRNYCKLGERVFDFFHQKDIGEQAWYYRKIAEYTSELSDTAQHREYVDLINMIFKGV